MTETRRGGVFFLFAVTSGIAAANVYYAQPLIAPIARELALPVHFAGSIVATMQVGFAAGLLLVVPLSDLFENRRIVVLALSAVVCGLLGVATAHSITMFLLSSLLVGVGSVASSVLVPFASQLTPPESRGRVVGIVMSGLLAGIVLARPLASYVAGEFGWRAVFVVAAALTLFAIALVLAVLPRREPSGQLGYRAIMQSMPALVLHTPTLRRRAFYQGMLFAAFSAFWTTVPLLLVDEFNLGHKGIALFTLAGAAGTFAAPIGGRLADRGLTHSATHLALAATVFAFLLSSAGVAIRSLTLLVIAALVLDAALQINNVLSLRCIYMLPPEQRGRLHGLYIAFIFLCGAVGSLSSAALYAFGDWVAIASLGAVLGAIALIVNFNERSGDPCRL